MNDKNNYNNDLRFDKLYELLGDEVNSIFNNKEKIFSDNINQVFINNENNVVLDNIDSQVFENDNVISQKSGLNNDNLVNNNINQIINNIPVNDLNSFNDNKNDSNTFSYNTYSKDITRNKVIINDSEFGDGIDTEEYDKNVRDISINRKVILILLILTFICVCIVVYKAFYYGKKVDDYENFFTVIENKNEEYTVVYDDKEIDSETLKKVAASELINCINSKIDNENLPDNVVAVIDEINSFYNQSYDYFSFLYRDIYTGFTVSYNENQNIFTASTIKAPKDIYIYEMASLGKINLDEELTYTADYYNTGTGVLKNKSINTKYTVRKLLEYSTVESDNAAHNMLMDKFKRDNMLKFWKEKGTNAIFTVNNNWGVINAHDASIYMQELYKFYINDSEFGEPLMKNFMNAHPKFISGKNNYVVANKSGWSGTAIHDVSIVFADNPYIVVGLSNLGTTDYYMYYFNKVNDLAYKLHTEYWKYKMSVCNDIKQY